MQINIRQEQFSERDLQSRARFRPVTPLGLRRCSGGYPEGSRGGGGDRKARMETNQFAPDEEDAALAGVLAVEADLESLRVRTGSGPPAPFA